jgi:hypothetical protein
MTTSLTFLDVSPNIVKTFLNIKSLLETEEEIDIENIEYLIGRFRSLTFKLENLETYLLCIHIIEQIESLIEIRKIIRK